MSLRDYMLMKENLEQLKQKAETLPQVTGWIGSDKKVEHIIHFDKGSSEFYQVSKDGENVLEVKVIDAKDLNKYKNWFSDDVFEKLVNATKV